MWQSETAIWEIILRAMIVFAFVILILRVTGNRQLGQMKPFHLVLIILLSNSVHHSILPPDDSMTAGLISAATLVALNYLVDILAFRRKKFSQFIDGTPKILVHNGQVYEEILKKEQITRAELMAALRAEGCLSLLQVRVAMLETNGNISVISRDGEDNESQGGQAGEQSVA